MKYKVNLKEVGLEDANKAYGGFLDAFSFHKTNFKDWFNVFRDDCLKAMETKTFFPVYRMADGEYRFLMGRAYNFYKRPLIKELIAVTAEKLHIKNPYKWETSWGEKYSSHEMKSLRKKLILDIKNISKKGKLACYWNKNGLHAFEEYNHKLIPFFKKHNINFSSKNYVPFHFVCCMLVKYNWKKFFLKKNILVVTGCDKISKKAIIKSFNTFGVNSTDFIVISKTSSMKEVINVENFKKKKIDMCLVAAGIGSANIISQLEPLNTLTIDIGGFINCYIDYNKSQHGGIFKFPL